MYATAPSNDQKSRVTASEQSASASLPTKSGCLMGFMDLIYSCWSRVIEPELSLKWWMPTQVKSVSFWSIFPNVCSRAWSSACTSDSSPVILISSTCLAIMRTKRPFLCLTSHSESVEMGFSPILWVTEANLILKAFGASLQPVPGLTHFRT